MTEAACSAPPELLAYLFGRSAACGWYLGSPIEPAASSLADYAAIFILTCLLEAPGYGLAGWWARQKPRRILGQVVALNLATHPLVFWFAPWALWKLGASTGSYLAWAEAFAFTVEALLLRFWARYSWGLSALASTAANLSSWWLGVWLVQSGLVGGA